MRPVAGAGDGLPEPAPTARPPPGMPARTSAVTAAPSAPVQPRGGAPAAHAGQLWAEEALCRAWPLAPPLRAAPHALPATPAPPACLAAGQARPPAPPAHVAPGGTPVAGPLRPYAPSMLPGARAALAGEAGALGLTLSLPPMQAAPPAPIGAGLPGSPAHAEHAAPRASPNASAPRPQAPPAHAPLHAAPVCQPAEPGSGMNLGWLPAAREGTMRGARAAAEPPAEWPPAPVWRAGEPEWVAAQGWPHVPLQTRGSGHMITHTAWEMPQPCVHRPLGSPASPAVPAWTRAAAQPAHAVAVPLRHDLAAAGSTAAAQGSAHAPGENTGRDGAVAAERRRAAVAALSRRRGAGGANSPGRAAPVAMPPAAAAARRPRDAAQMRDPALAALRNAPSGKQASQRKGLGRNPPRHPLGARSAGLRKAAAPDAGLRGHARPLPLAGAGYAARFQLARRDASPPERPPDAQAAASRPAPAAGADASLAGSLGGQEADGVPGEPGQADVAAQPPPAAAPRLGAQQGVEPPRALPQASAGPSAPTSPPQSPAPRRAAGPSRAPAHGAGQRSPGLPVLRRATNRRLMCFALEQACPHRWC